MDTSGAGAAASEDQPTPPLADERLGPVPYAHVFRPPWRRLRAVLVPSVPVLLLGLVGLVAAQAAGGTAIVDHELAVSTLSPVAVVVSVVLLVAAVASAVLGHAAATLVALAETAGRRPALHWAFATTVRRLRTVLALWALGALLVAVLTAGAVVLAAVGAPVWLAVGCGCVAGWVAFARFALAWPVALAERRGCVAALRRSWRLTAGRAGRVGAYVLVFGYGVPAAVGYGVRQLPGDAWAGTVTSGVLQWVVSVLALALLASVQVAALCREDAVAVRDGVDADRVRDVLADAETPEWRWPARRTGDALVRTLAALLVPGLLATLLLWWNPVGVPAYRQDELGDASNFAVRLVPLPDGDTATVVATSDTAYVGLCGDDDCGSVSSFDLAGTAVTSAPDGRLVFSGWRSHRRDDPRGGWSELRLAACAPRRCGSGLLDRVGPASPVIDDYRPGYEDDKPLSSNLRTAIGRDGVGGYVVASQLRETEDRPRGLSFVHCADLRCAHPARTVLGETGIDLVPYRSDFLSVAADHGRVAVAVADPKTGAVTLFTCTDLDCTHPTRATVAGRSWAELELDTRYLIGVHVAFGTGGRPVLAYRDAGNGAIDVAACGDLGCADRTVHRVTGTGWARPWPALAVDRTGRPLVATYDLADRRFVLVSCTDTRCAHSRSVPLGRWDHGPGQVGLALDGAGRPVLAWSDTDPENQYFGEGPLRVLRCAAPRCGAR